MTTVASSSRTSPELPSLSHTASTSVSTSMPVSPRTDTPASKDETQQNGEEAPINVKELAEELKDGDESDPNASARATRLSFLLDKSQIYAKIIGDRMARQQIEKRKAEKRAETRKANKEKEQKGEAAASGRGGTRGKKAVVKEEEEDTSTGKRRRKSDAKGANKKAKVEETDEEKPVKDEAEPAANGTEQQDDQKVNGDVKPEGADGDAEEDDGEYTFAQPALVTGAKLRDYQLAGVQWMISLYENGLNGILADEMGLGKTLQTISFLAHLRSKGTWGPFLVVCPLSVLNNWVMEFEKFCPTIPVLMYHGSKEERAEMRATRMQPPPAAGVGKLRSGVKGKGGGTSHYKKGTNTPMSFPVIITTYEICMNDKQFLSGFLWKYIVVDEGHRLKNLDCKLIRELKTYTSANRLILTGTPLHNNLAELWSLLNFILPDIFDDLDSFQQWFNFDDMNSGDANAGILNKGSVVSSLHAILKPFLLRRLKVDVEKDLPPKKEYLLYAPLTQQQKDIYQAIVSRNIRQYLVDKRSGRDEDGAKVEEEEEEDGATPDLSNTPRSTRKQGRVDYKIEENDSKYIDNLEKQAGKPKPKLKNGKEQTATEVGQEWAHKQATKHVNNMRLQNLVMQLRKISSHPFLFDWPADPETNELVVNDDLVNASGKMLLLNRLLDSLFEKGHKVLLFSQFTTMLDVIEDWATSFKGFKICRIDGSTSQQSRREQMHEFNNGGDDPDACKLFLLSTRAGGLGVNLVAADTVIFFDQDWNPQMDLQAQDRAHRIGQTRPVLIFRLVSAHTIETKILQKAGNKRKLEALVISQGKFGRVVDDNGKVLLGRSKTTHESMAGMAKALLDLEGEEINVASAGDKIISDEDLEVLLDRSPEAFAREKGWSAGLGQGGKRAEQIKKGERTAFEVFETAKDEASNGLATMFNGDGEQEETVE